MKRWHINLLKKVVPPPTRIWLKNLIGFPVPVDSNYEPATQEALRHLLRPGDVVYDVGANVGELSVVMSRLVTTSGHVYAFEANPHCVAVLRKTLRLNRVDNCTVVFGAVCDQSELAVCLHADESRGTHGASSSLLPTWADVPKREVVVPAVKLDEFCALHRVAPKVVKIDVEGAERMVLEGFQEHLRRARPHIILEVLSDGTGRTDGALHHLESSGYRIALPGPWRWTTADEFSAQERFERTVLAVHRDALRLVQPWVGFRRA